ncbi:hypothetical protein GCM10011508_13060 [Flavobacterium lutivivi]|nr:hypothetical protein GCM10011508_13060 [Flavobacterium lutivivi]
MKPADLYMLNQPEKYRDMIFHVVSVFEKNVPQLTLEYKWKIPYFYYKGKPFCFINVSHKRKYLDLGFNKGFQLKNNLEYLIAGDGRNTFKSLRYFSLEEIDNEILISVIQEAITLY